MNTVHVIAAMLVALSIPAVFAGESVAPPLTEDIVDGKVVVSPLIEDVSAGNQVSQTNQAMTEPGQEDDSGPMRELCASYADDEGVAAEDRKEHIDECIKSMTELSDSMQETPVSAGTDPEPLSEAGSGVKDAAGAGATDANPEALSADASLAKTQELPTTHPEDLVADELVDKPAQGVEELIPKPATKTK